MQGIKDTYGSFHLWIKRVNGSKIVWFVCGGRLGPGHIVLDGDPAPPHGKGHSSLHFSAHVYCDQTVVHLNNCWALVKDACGWSFVPLWQSYIHFAFINTWSDRQVHRWPLLIMRRWCGLMSNYFDHLLLLILLVYSCMSPCLQHWRDNVSTSRWPGCVYVEVIAAEFGANGSALRAVYRLCDGRNA